MRVVVERHCADVAFRGGRLSPLRLCWLLLLLVLLCLRSVVCALLASGMSFYGTYTDFDPHTNFSTFLLSLVTIMRIITQDSWETVLFVARGHTPYAPLYFISVMVMVGMVMVNLFMAVVVVRGEGMLALSCASGTHERCASLAVYVPVVLLCVHLMLPFIGAEKCAFMWL